MSACCVDSSGSPGNETPVDLAAVQADDALLDMLGASRVALRWAAERIDGALGSIPPTSEEREPLPYEYWRGYRDSAVETAQTLRWVADGAADADLIRALVAWRRDVDAEPVAAIRAAREPRRRRHPVLGQIAAFLAVLMIAVAAMGLLAKDAGPDDLLWSVHELLYSRDGAK